MKIASLGPNGVVLSQTDADAPEIESTPDSVRPLSEDTPAETNMSKQNEKAKFTRIFDLIQASEKKGKLKNKSKLQNQKKLRAIRKYQLQKESASKQETIGTLLSKLR